MSAIESCRTAALGGHVARCEECSHTIISYNSCRNRHCPNCQGLAAKEWLADRGSEPPAGTPGVLFDDGMGNQGVGIEALAEARALAGENVVVSWLGDEGAPRDA